MEFGNYGYKDEMTGAGWNQQRTNLETEIPLRHWHLNDPGVVPNLLQTGAGSPTGITVYEGTLLPKVFQNQIIHCDPGLNVCRAYPVTRTAPVTRPRSSNVLYGARDNWFRPSDVCVAPDGSLFVADWYDPGVGGHNQQEVDKGRIFRVAPTGVKYTVPKFDFSTAGRRRRGLEEPELLGSLSGFHGADKDGQAGQPALAKLYDDKSNSRVRARRSVGLGANRRRRTCCGGRGHQRRRSRYSRHRRSPGSPTETRFDQGRRGPGRRSRPRGSPRVCHRLASWQDPGSGRRCGPNWRPGTMARIAGIWKPWGSEPTRIGMPSWTLIWPRSATSGTRPRDATSSGAAGPHKTPEMLVKIHQGSLHQRKRISPATCGRSTSRPKVPRKKRPCRNCWSWSNAARMIVSRLLEAAST